MRTPLEQNIGIIAIGIQSDAIKNYRVNVLAVTRRLIKPFVLTTSKINAELTAVVPVGRVTAGAV